MKRKIKIKYLLPAMLILVVLLLKPVSAAASVRVGSTTIRAVVKEQASSGSSDDEADSGIGKETVTVQRDTDKTPEVTVDEETLSELFDETDTEEVLAGNTVQYVLEILDESQVDTEDKESIEECVSEDAIICYLDLSLYRYVWDGEGNQVLDEDTEEGDGRITEANTELTITIAIPADMLEEATEDAFYVLRVHDDEVTRLEDEDDDPETVTISTDKFSTYAIVYDPETASNGDTDGNSSGGSTSEDGNTEGTTDTTDDSTDGDESGEEDTDSTRSTLVSSVTDSVSSAISSLTTKTGDDKKPITWGALGLIACAVIGLIIYKKKRKVG